MKNFIGTAAWNIPKLHSELFPLEGTHLYRYSQIFNSVEINSSFYKHHQNKTYSKWANIVPEDFRFSVKLSKVFTHDNRFVVDENLFLDSVDAIMHLEQKLGVILIQIPPSFKFDPYVSEAFFKLLRRLYKGPIAFEPRHGSWLDQEAQNQLLEFKISKVIADPTPCSGGDPQIYQAGGVVYYRLHGTPEIYKSPYEASYLQSLAAAISYTENAWCIFDNTTFGHATENALALKHLINQRGVEHESYNTNV